MSEITGNLAKTSWLMLTFGASGPRPPNLGAPREVAGLHRGERALFRAVAGAFRAGT